MRNSIYLMAALLALAGRNSGAWAQAVPDQHERATASTEAIKGSGASCSFDIECDDGNRCTFDRCDIESGAPVGSGACTNTGVAEGEAGDCDDGVFCNGFEHCAAPQGGGPLVCTPGTPASCCESVCAELGRCSAASANQGASCNDHADCPGGKCDRCPHDCRVRRCSASSTNAGEMCTVDGDCPSGRCMTENENCADASLCNGAETCNMTTGLCQAGADPCGPNAKCFDRRCVGSEAEGGLCRNDASCEGGLCQPSTVQCYQGRCCSIAAEPLCTFATAATCSGNWYEGAAGFEQTNPIDPTGPCGGYDALNAPADAWGCPLYSAGITSTFAQSSVIPPARIERVGPISISPTTVSLGSYAGALKAVGDDYQLLGPYGIGVDAVRLVAACEGTGGCRVSVEFYDQEEGFIGRTAPVQIDGSEPLTRVIGVYPAISIPATGFVVFRALSPAGSDSAGSLFIMSTNDADVGGNSPSILWVNGGQVANFLPNGAAGILAVELVGDQQLDPVGACCDGNGGDCVETQPWVCAADAGSFRLGAHCAQCVGGEHNGTGCRTCQGGSEPGTAVCTAQSVCDARGLGGTCQANQSVCAGRGSCTNDPYRFCDNDMDCPGKAFLCSNTDEFCLVDGDCPPSGTCGGSGTCISGACVANDCATGACCISVTGECTEAADASACSALNGNFLGGGTCEPNCCLQPAVSGADQPANATVHDIVVPAAGAAAVTLTISGDSSAASNTSANPDSCAARFSSLGLADLGWWESFHIDACANVRVDFCCSVTSHAEKWMFLTTDLAGDAVIGPSPNPGSFGETEAGVGAPYCNDANAWYWFTSLPAGTYYLPVPSPTVGPVGPYQLHLTVEPCARAACCLHNPLDPDYPCASGLTAEQCESRNGTFLGPPNRYPAQAACTAGLCDSGACCVNGACQDAGENGGVPMDRNECASRGGEFVPNLMCHGARCANNLAYSCLSTDDCQTSGAGCPFTGNCCVGTPEMFAQPNPCRLCKFDDDRHCQDSGLLVYASDTSAEPPARVAEDVSPLATGVLESLCVKGAYDGPAGWNCQDQSGGVQDEFTVRVFESGSVEPIPERLLGAYATSVSVNRSAPFNPGNNRDCFEYQLQLIPDAPNPLPILLAGNTYFIEVTNSTPGGDPQCFWHWLEAGADVGNDFGLADHGSTYQVEDVGSFDLSLCANVPFSAPSPLGGPARACCTGDSDRPCELLIAKRCGQIRGKWLPETTSCDSVLCLPPANDQCANAAEIGDGPTAFDNFAATRDGPLEETCNGSTIIEAADIWYDYTATCTGTARLSMCHSDSVGKHVISVYHSTATPTACLCPTDPGFTLLSCSQEPVPNQVHPQGCPLATGADLVIAATQGDCYTVRVSGELGTTAPGSLRITCGSAVCGNGIKEAGNGEQCDGDDDAFCPGECDSECRCPMPTCGDGIAAIGLGEECDGDDDAACPGLCAPPELAPFGCQCLGGCGNGIRDPGEECDEFDDTLCPGNCTPAGPGGCTCISACGDNVKDPSEDCDGTDASNCPGACNGSCECPPVACGNDVVEMAAGEECDGTAAIEFGALCEPEDCRPPGDPAGECTCVCGPTLIVEPDPLIPNTSGTCTSGNAACDIALQNCPGASGPCDPCGQMRLLSFRIPPTSAGMDTAIRVKLTSIYHPAPPLPTSGTIPDFSGPEGNYRYLDTVPGAFSRCCAPNQGGGSSSCNSNVNCISDADCAGLGSNTKCEKNLCPDSPAFKTFFRCARLTCLPVYRDWGADFSSMFAYVYGDTVVSDSQYDVTQIPSTCAGDETNCPAASIALTINTERWGNIDCSAAVVPSAADLALLVNKVKDAPGALAKPRCQMQPATLNALGQNANAQDIGRHVDSVKGYPYPIAFTIAACPNDVN